MDDARFLPRGAGKPKGTESAPSRQWVHPDQLGRAWDFDPHRPGMLLLGHWNGRLIGNADDRHVCMLAQNRAGKTRSCLLPNLHRYLGSCVILDPKGELFQETAAARRALGQRVYKLDPFDVTGWGSSSFNPFEELNTTGSHLGADAAQAVDAIIINNAKDSHWTDAAKNILRAYIVYFFERHGKAPTLRQMRRFINATPEAFGKVLEQMMESKIEAVANAGAAFAGKQEEATKELQSILSTAQEQTAPFDDVAHISDRSDFRLTDLRNGDMTIYLILPGFRMGTHYRWLRLVIQMALGAMERAKVPLGQQPVLFVLEEFATLGHMRSLEIAAGLVAGYGVKLWLILQDLTQLKTHYAKSWETFLNNAGIVQAFGNSDLTTCEYLSKRLGLTQITERQEIRVSSAAMAQGDLGRRYNMREVPLLHPSEINAMFARDTGRQLILTASGFPVYLNRLTDDMVRP